MKILMLSDMGSIHTKRWVKSLSERGCSILLFSLRDDDGGFYVNMNNVKVRCALANESSSYWDKVKYLKSVSTVKKLIKEYKPDIVHAHYASSYGFIGSLTRTNVPYVISVWGSDVYDFPNIVPFGKQIIRFNLKKADKILSTSHVMAKETMKYTDKEIDVTPFGVDTELFKPQPFNDNEEFVIGNVKTLRPKYGIDVLIQAANIVIKNNPSRKIRLDIYGDGPQKEELIQLAESLGIANKVNFKGFVKNDELPIVYNGFSVSVSPSICNSESFGVVAVEAMAGGCPVVTSDADGFTEVVVNDVTGFIVPKRNPEATANAIQRFIDNPELREIMGMAGCKRVKKLYDWNDNVYTMIQIYKDIISI